MDNKVGRYGKYNDYFVTVSPYVNEKDIEAFLKRNSKKMYRIELRKEKY